jgi:hypothetical protein
MSAHSALVNRILMRYSVRPDLTLWKMNTGVARALYGERVMRYGIDGGTDIIGIMKPDGRWIAIEVKTGSGELRPNQRAFRQVMLDHGALYILARHEDDVRAALEQLNLKGLDSQCAAL